MAGQYSYGDSQSVPRQAANLLDRLLVKRPFAEGNLRTAFLAALTFANGNGYATKAGNAEAVDILQSVARREKTAEAAISELTAPAVEALPQILSLRQLITHECNHHKAILKALAPGD